jgi:hypothetical protein
MSHRSRSGSCTSRDGPTIRSASSTDAEIAALRSQQRADRDARSVGRRLQKHQVETSATLDAMQNRMEAMALLQSQMTTMMQQMQGSINRLVPDEGMNTTVSPSIGNGRPFSTPPTRTNTNLSPIPEGSTPIPTPTPQISHLFLQPWANSHRINSHFAHAPKVFVRMPVSSPTLPLAHPQGEHHPPTYRSPNTPTPRPTRNTTSHTPLAKSSMIQHHTQHHMNSHTRDHTSPNTTPHHMSSSLQTTKTNPDNQLPTPTLHIWMLPTRDNPMDTLPLYHTPTAPTTHQNQTSAHLTSNYPVLMVIILEHGFWKLKIFSDWLVLLVRLVSDGELHTLEDRQKSG